MKVIKFFIPAMLLILCLIAASNYRYSQRVSQTYAINKAEFVAALSDSISQHLNGSLNGDVDKIDVYPDDTADGLRLHITWLNSEFLRQMDYTHQALRTEFVVDTKVTTENDMLFLFNWPCVRAIEQQPLTTAAPERLMQVRHLVETIAGISPKMPLTSDARWPPSISERARTITRISIKQDSIVFTAGVPWNRGEAYMIAKGRQHPFDVACR
ncbi:MAG: hypothetical protein VW877_01260 [Pseudomonadaceae bacterium]